MTKIPEFIALQAYNSRTGKFAQVFNKFGSNYPYRGKAEFYLDDFKAKAKSTVGDWRIVKLWDESVVVWKYKACGSGVAVNEKSKP